MTLSGAIASYYALAELDEGDLEEAEGMRQFVLWCVWRLGGNPMQLDPNWIPPVGG